MYGDKLILQEKMKSGFSITKGVYKGYVIHFHHTNRQEQSVHEVGTQAASDVLNKHGFKTWMHSYID